MTTLIKIGNSQGVRIPKIIIEQAQLIDKKLEFKIVDDGLLIHPVKKPRQGWKAQFDRVSKLKESDDANQEWLDTPLADTEGWEW